MENKEDEDDNHHNAFTYDRRVEIDTRAPFRSVKEAVMLFGERILAHGIYAAKLEEMRAANNRDYVPTYSKLESITAELEETRECLEKAREDSLAMEHYLVSLQEELEKTKRELQELKQKESDKKQQHVIDMLCPTEDMKLFVEKPDKEASYNLQKKSTSVKLAKPPSLTRVMTVNSSLVLDRNSSVNAEVVPKKKKKMFPLIGGLFNKKKGHPEMAAAAAAAPSSSSSSIITTTRSHEV